MEKKESSEEMIENAAYEFAKKLASQAVHDPNGKQSRRKSRSYSGYTKEQIEGFLKAPTSNEKSLRDASIYLYQTNSRYRNLVQYFANIPSWLYIITAVNYNPSKGKPENFKKQYYKACNILESMNLQRTMREVTTTAIREGVYFGVIWGGDGSSFILQKLDADYCQIINISDGGVFNFAYNMTYVKEADLNGYYPPEFREMYNNYLATGEQYQPVPSNIGFCLKADPTVVEYSIPPFASVLPLLFSIKKIEDLAATSEELQNYKMLSALVPTDDNGVPTMDYKTVMQYYQHISNNLADMVGLCVSPFKIEEHDFENSAATAQIDAVGRATENFFSSAGTTALVHGLTNSTSSVTKLALSVDVAYSFGYVQQCASIVNRFLRQLSGTQKFKITFLPVSIFNRGEMFDYYRNALNYGMGKAEYMACLGVPQHDIANKAYIENEIIAIDKQLTPLKTAATQSAEDNKGGRPAESDDEIDSAGEATRNSGANENRD